MRGDGKYSNSIDFGCDEGSDGADNLRISQAVERRGDREGALELFDRAVRLAPENALVRYRRAKILVSMRKYGVRDYFRLPYSESSKLTFLPDMTPF